MKKFMATALVLFFLTASSGLVWADVTPSTTNGAKKTTWVKKSHKGRHHKKVKRTLAARPTPPAK